MNGKNGGISSTLTVYYLTFILLTFITAVTACALTYMLGMLAAGNYSPPVLNAIDIAQADYKIMNINDIERVNGWVEIIRNGNVVFVLGQKKDQKSQYSQNEFNFPQNGYGYGKKVLSNFNDSQYSYSASVFTGYDSNEYICLVKIPIASLERSIHNFLDFNNPVFEKDRLTCLVIAEGIGIFSLLYIVCVFIFSRITSRKISSPLKAISEGIKSMSSGDYRVRLDFKAESEFAAIRDIFNFMADRLEAAENEKNEAEESKKNMIMGISHDLKTPITTVFGYAKALNEGMADDEEKRRKYLQYICAKAENMTKMIDDLFIYSKLDSSRYQLNKVNDDFSEFVRELVAASFIEISSRGFQLEPDISEDPIMYMFDRNEMYRAISNILNNCLKYNPDRTTLGISLRKEGDEIVLVIRDNGVGISEELKDRIFNEFVRGNAARQSDGGSGLGLAIARRIIKMHGGDIEINSELGKGSAFTIHLPY